MHKNNFLVHIKCNKKLLKENSDIVQIPFDSNYSIVMKNMDSRRCIVSIQIDGKSIGNDLVLNGNQLLNLKRFIENNDSGNKFKFVKKESESTKSLDIDQGFIRIEVKWEKPKINNYFENSEPYIYKFRPIPYISWNQYPPQYDGPLCHKENTGSEDMYKTVVSKSATIDNEIVYVKIPEPNERVFRNSNVDFSSQKLEEGITVKGKKCDQKFVTDTIGELEQNSIVFVFKLMGYEENKTLVR